MKKKRQEISVIPNHVVDDWKSKIHEHALFFDKLVVLIPARFYVPNDENDKPWFQGLSKSQKAMAKKESKENLKKARRDRMDPEKSSTSTLDLLKQGLEKKNMKDHSDDDETDVKPMSSRFEGDDRSVTYEELRQRLHKKIEEFKTNRNTGCSNREKKRIERNERRELYEKKRKRESPEEKKPVITHSAEEVEKNVMEASKELAFSHVNLGTEEEKKKKRKLSKLKELDRARKLEEEKKDPEKGETLSKKHSWQAATSRAAGDKVHDDPKLLMKSIRKEKKQQLKNVEKWKGRIETTQKMKAERQQKRSDNISQKIKDKKMRRIAKREKKLMRPGFEGRKEGFINAGTS